MKRYFFILFILALPAFAQQPATGVDEGNLLLEYDPENDYFERGRNLHDAAKLAENEAQRREQYSLAARVFSSYLKEYPNHANSEKALWYLGNCYYQAGHKLDARRTFGELVNRYREGPWVAAASYTMAADHYNKGEYVVAAPLFERYADNVEASSEKVRGWFYAGSCYRLLGRDHQALKVLGKVATAEDAGDYGPRAELAIAHVSVKIGRLDDAQEWFAGILDRPDLKSEMRGEAMLHMALLARKQKKGEVAEAYLTKLLAAKDLKVFHAEAEAALMASLFGREAYGEVIALYKGSKVTIEGKLAATRMMTVGRAYMRLKQHKEALSIFRLVERLVSPDSEMAYEASFYRLLCFYQIEGRHVPEQVDAFLQLYRAARPNDYRIHTALMMKAETLYANQRGAEAAQVYNEVDASLVSEQNRPGLYYQRGWCLAEAGDLLGAVRSLTAFIKKYPDDSRVPSALAKRARVYQDSGKPELAIVDYDRVIETGNPVELVSLAWLESARLKRSDRQIPEMVARYRGLLEGVKELSDELKAEAHYWIGWGLVKSNQAGESTDHLEQARALRGELYSKHVGLLLALGYFATQNTEQLALEVERAIKEGYADQLPDQSLQWVGMQSYNGGDFKRAATFLDLLAKPAEPRATPKEVWRYLAKSKLELGQAEAALMAVEHALEVEKDLAWRADGLLDRGRALYALKRYEESREAVDLGLGLHPQGRTSGSLRLLMGDLEMQAGDAKKASAQYLIVVSFMDDDKLKPLALSKLITAFESQGDAAQADKYRQQLASEFANWEKSR